MFNSRSKTNYKTQKQVFLVLLAHMAKESELVRNVTNYAGKNSRMIQWPVYIIEDIYSNPTQKLVNFPQVPLSAV